jgi:hypothetical protein
MAAFLTGGLESLKLDLDHVLFVLRCRLSYACETA